MPDQIQTAGEGERVVALVDCDVHPTPILEEVVDYIPEPWRSRYFRGDPNAVDIVSKVYLPPLHAARTDAVTPSGGPPGSDPAFARKQLLEEVGVDYAMLLCQIPRAKLGQPELENALLAGTNSWLEATWLSEHNKEGRFRGAIRVCPYDVPGAVAEIERWAGHPYVGEIYIIPEAEAPFGQRRFDPIYEAATRAGVPIALHVSRTPGMRLLTPVGFPSYHVEIFPQWPLYFMGHLASFIFDGAFDRFPDLRVVSVEGGFTWIGPFSWRLDRYWEALGGEATGAARRPSEYLAEHMRFTTQPLEEPRTAGALEDAMSWIDAERLLMFSTDYPHYDFDHPNWITPRIPPAFRSRIFAQNAIEFFGLPSTRPYDEIDRAAGRVPAAVA